MGTLRRFTSGTPGKLLLLGGLCLLCAYLLWRPPFGLPPLWAVVQQGEQVVHTYRRPPQQVLAHLKVPAGFQVSLYNRHVPGARMLRFTAAGDLLVSSPRQSSILLIPPARDRPGAGDPPRVVLDHLDLPHGLDLHDGKLYVAEGGAVFSVPFDDRSGKTTAEPTYLVRDLPKGGGHWTRTLRVGPDNHLYVSVGSSCNVCIEKDPRRAAILRYDLDGQNGAIFASGLRNSVGLAFQPGTGDLYATDNGRDLLGDDFPPCELNLIEQGQFYGWPYSSGDRVIDPDFGKGHQADIDRSRVPVHKFHAHNAPLGITFAQGARLPAAYNGAAFVALHGSWNRSKKDGYKVVALIPKSKDDSEGGGKGGFREEDFLTGFLEDQTTLGRPVDVAVGPDGALYVSDDLNGVVYRVAYTG